MKKEFIDSIYFLDGMMHKGFNWAFGSELRPMMRKLIGRNDLVGAEIGTLYGDYAVSILNHLDIKMLYLVDPWKDYDSYSDNYNNGVEKMPRVYIKTLFRFKNEKRVKLIRNTSDMATKNVPDDLDFVYIDGNHAYEYVKNDLVNWYPKVKIGGIIGGHDFDNSVCAEHDGIIQAVTEFSVKNKFKLFVGSPDYWMVK